MSKAPFPVVEEALGDLLIKYDKSPFGANMGEVPVASRSFSQDWESILDRHGWTEDGYCDEWYVRYAIQKVKVKHE